MTELADVSTIVVTGGPAAGKTTALSLLAREFCGQVVVIAESATTLFDGGMPRPRDNSELRTVQSAIFGLQTSMEELYRRRHPDCLIICDRGRIDGAAYWPNNNFFEHHGTTLDEELERYDMVFHLQTSARLAEANAPWERFETASRAVELDKRLSKLWSKHPRFIEIAPNHSLLAKISELTKDVRAIVEARA